MSEDFFPRARTRRVEGGIKARSARGAIGESWWSRRFLAVLESFALGSRLTRGKNYARAGQVLALDVTPGLVVASVQGSRAKPYAVRVRLEPFTERVWRRVEEMLAAQALFSARLLAGELPGEIEDVFRAADAPLFPSALTELAMSCSCPDYAVPCKHLAATFYLLAEAFDTDPFQILRWRGRDREVLLSRLRDLRGGFAESSDAAASANEDSAAGGAVTARGAVTDGGAAVPDGGVGADSTVGAAAALGDVHSPPLVDVLDRFWLSPVPLTGKPQHVLDTEPDLLLRQLPTPGPRLGGSGLVDALRWFYQRKR
jgi:uncharacterized Zn finger protein